MPSLPVAAFLLEPVKGILFFFLCLLRLFWTNSSRVLNGVACLRGTLCTEHISKHIVLTVINYFQDNVWYPMVPYPLQISFQRSFLTRDTQVIWELKKIIFRSHKNLNSVTLYDNTYFCISWKVMISVLVYPNG